MASMCLNNMIIRKFHILTRIGASLQLVPYNDIQEVENCLLFWTQVADLRQIRQIRTFFS